jgi:hypothetical protein
LNLLLAFLTPKIDPAMELDDEDGDGMELPTRQSDEFRPFIRRLPGTVKLLQCCYNDTDSLISK